MRHLKLYTKLTLGQKLVALVLILNISLVFNFTPTTAWAEDADPSTTTPNISVVVNGTDPAASPAGSCAAIEEDLNKKFRELSAACSATNLRNCTANLFQCDEANDSETCDAMNNMTSAASSDAEEMRLETEKEELAELNEKRKELMESKEQAQKEVDELNEELEEKQSQLVAADEEFRLAMKNIEDRTGLKLSEIQANISALEESNNSLLGKISEQKVQMIQLMAAGRLKCNEDSRKAADNFYAKARACSSGRGNCNISLNALIRNGNHSLAEMAQAHGRVKRRQCLRTDGDNDFAVEFRKVNAIMREHRIQIAQQQKTIASQRNNLYAQITQAKQAGKLEVENTTSNIAARARNLSAQEGRLKAQIAAKSALIVQNEVLLKDNQSAIEAKAAAVASARRSIQSSLASGELNKLREAQLLAPGLMAEAQDAEASCGCTGSIRSISNFSGANFCPPRAGAEETETYVDAEEGTL